MTTVDLPLMVYLVFNLVVLAGVCYLVSALLRAAKRNRMLREVEVLRVRKMAKESPVDPMRAADSHLNWLDIKHRRFLRRNGHETADAAIILGGLELAQHRAHIAGTPASVIPAPIRKQYRDYFGPWELFKMGRFTRRITARLGDEPAGHIVYHEFARKVLNDSQLKELLDAIDKFAPEPTTVGPNKEWAKDESYELRERLRKGER